LILLPRPASLHLGFNGWQAGVDLPTEPAGLGLHALTLPAPGLAGHRRLDFSWRWGDGAGDWVGEDFHLDLTERNP
jgi:glucoamylase